MTEKLSCALNRATQMLADAGCASPRNDAQIIAAELLGVSTTDLFLRGDDPSPQGFESFIARRAAREPLQHILGKAWFGPLELQVGPGVFIPRPETEVLADWAVTSLAAMRKKGALAPTVVDLCTGSGALAAYIAHADSGAQVYAVELSDKAAEFAETNFRNNNLDVSLVCGDVRDDRILANLNGKVDLLVTNPPYVPESDDLEPEVYKDPHMAVFSGTDGMELIIEMMDTCGRLLKSGGLVGIEHDDTTSAEVIAACQASGYFVDINAMEDFTGRKRFVRARRK